MEIVVEYVKMQLLYIFKPIVLEDLDHVWRRIDVMYHVRNLDFMDVRSPSLCVTTLPSLLAEKKVGIPHLVNLCRLGGNPACQTQTRFVQSPNRPVVEK